jgi:hypothetical protein
VRSLPHDVPLRPTYPTLTPGWLLYTEPVAIKTPSAKAGGHDRPKNLAQRARRSDGGANSRSSSASKNASCMDLRTSARVPPAAVRPLEHSFSGTRENNARFQ